MKRIRPAPQELCLSQRRPQSTFAQPSDPIAGEEVPESQPTEPVDPTEDMSRFPPLDPTTKKSARYPSPLPERALKSAKLAALRARLALSEKIPLQTLARALVDSTADKNKQFNNTNLAFLGHTLINYHVSEYLMVRYPRLPMAIMYSAVAAYAGPDALHTVARQWGIEAAAVPGGEVDPGLLQFSTDKTPTVPTTFGSRRAEADYLDKFNWRRGINSRVVLDDDFGNVVQSPSHSDDAAARSADNNAALRPYGTPETRKIAETAYANAVRAVAGAVYAHRGREAVKAFVKAHILSRQLDLSRLFAFKMPTRELSNLCAREEFEKPVARLLSETGRRSRTPVFVVGIYSGSDKLGEGAGPNLDAARWKAAMNALKAWYLYSPGEDVRVPSDMLVEDARPWEPAHIDIGEVI
ncbi:Ribonuclease III [Coniochaeta hoffmannii]|uniref:Large ribosomal subunit protein mL44 n=1 Tax=Coniochaeta hoffmannii TaxID=91930 RepID=A0AA38W004_9PEZI|nr:Ribonuclease III [Coniochaeta hoffmannii]